MARTRLRPPSSRGGLGTMPKSSLRVGTCNVRSLTGKMGAVMDLAANAGVNLLCLQETKLTQEGLHAMRQAFRAKGWKLLPGPLAVDSAGKASGGVAVITDWPVEVLEVPVAAAFPTRVMAVKAHRPAQRPLLVINGYLPAADDQLNQHIASTVLRWATTSGEDFVFLADWNRTPNQQPLCGFLAGGLVYAMDPDPFLEGKGTHRLENGDYTGRLIDFGLSSTRLAVDGRAQHLGPADHDLVTYDVHLLSGRRGWRWQPQLRLDEDKKNVDWQAHWHSLDASFKVALDENDTETAWRLLSGAAEAALAQDGARPAKPRGVPGKPLLTEAHAGKTPSVQTLRERKLRRAARRAKAVLEGSAPPDGSSKLLKYLQHLADVFPDLGQVVQLRGSALLAFLLEKAAEEEARANRARLDKWATDVQTDLPRLARWVKASAVERPTAFEDFAEDPDPQAKAEAAAVVWGDRWNRLRRPDGAALHRLLGELDITAAQAPSLRLEGHALLRRAKATARKAPGCDGWAGRHWRLLSEDFFDLLAAVWNAVLGGAPIPQAWTQVRICLIPKGDGGSRPLAIASLAWRLGAACLVQQLGEWIRQVFPKELYGGLPDRSADDVHAELTQAMYVQRGGGPLAGCKADVRRCFDSASPDLALQCLRQMGAPAPLLDVMGRFYDQQERWIMVDGATCRRPLRACGSLLQGCPVSPLCLGAMMVVWAATVQRANTGVQLAIYIDDRTMWVRKRWGAARAVRDAMMAGAVADDALGFTLHPEKLESFATTQAVREDLLGLADIVGIPQVTFTLLGIPYNTTRAAPVATAGVAATLMARCKRIQKFGGSRSLRCVLLKKLVIPLFRWAAPWLRFSKKLLATWTAAIERAAWGGGIPRGRSPALAWLTVVGVDLLPAYVCAETAVLREHRRLHLQRHSSEATFTAEAFKAVDWKRGDDGTWTTRHGCFRAGAISAEGLRRQLRLAWARKLLLKDNKTKQEGGFVGDFDLAHHLTTGRHVDGYKARVMAGAAADSRHLVEKGGTAADFVCDCGRRGPTRSHLTFECSSAPWTLELRSALERRLLLPLGPSAPRWDMADYEADVAKLVQHLAGLDATQVHYVATDGGCALARGAEFWQRAAWGVAFENGEFGGLVLGAEQTAAEGERVAVYLLAMALLQCGRSIRLLVDNQAVAGRLRRGRKACENGDPWALWRVIADAVHLLDVAWVPSHGKKPLWGPPPDWLDGVACRALNARADAAATQALDAVRAVVVALVRAAKERRAWAAAAVAAQMRATQPWHVKFVEKMRVLAFRRRAT